MNQKSEKKKFLRAKSDTQMLNISEPYAFKHDFHVGQEHFDERKVDATSLFPQIPCSDTAGDFLVTSSTFSEVIKKDVIQAIRCEIADIVEEKLRYVLNEHKGNSDSRHCTTCLCFENKTIREEDVLINMKESDRDHLVKDVKSGEMYEGSDSTKRKGVTSTEYNVKEREALKNEDDHMSSRHNGKLVKYGSDIHLANPVHLEREKYSGFMRTRTLPVLAKTLSQSYNEMPYHKGRPFSKYDERKCLADALQWHVEELIDGIVFKDSELPDDLLGDSCLTDEECASIRTTLDRKNQVRVLLSIIKGRDMRVLQRFLKHIKIQNEPLARSIVEKFELNKSNGVRCSECALCNLTSNVNLKYIADRLWRHNLIEGGLFNWIIQSDKPTGVQGILWRGVISSLNVHCKKYRSDVCAILSAALTKNNHYDHVAKGLERMIGTHGELACRCQVQPNVIQSAESLLSLQSSRSPRSSEFDTNSKSEAIASHIDQTSDNYQNQQGPNAQKDYMNETSSQDHLSTVQDTVHTEEAKEISPRHSSHTDVNQGNDYVVLEKFTDSSIKQKDEFPNFSSVMSKIPPEDNNIIMKTSSSAVMSTYVHGKTNVSLSKDENSKLAVSERNRKVYNAHDRQIFMIFSDELESSIV